jgi:hypothetical protein
MGAPLRIPGAGRCAPAPACSIDRMKPQIILLPDVTFASNGLDTIFNAPMA